MIALAFAACGFDETPILPSPDAATAAGTVSTGAGGVGGVPSMPPGAVVASPDAGDTPLPPGAFGLDCGGETCPVAPLGATQCCTTVADVTSRAAREGDHCGVDVTAAGGAAGCHQLEQSGVLDPSCPADQPPGSSIEEAGCCSDEGWCGTFDVARGIGCRHGDGPEQRCDDEVDMGVTCEATGHFAVQAAIDVAWGGRGVGGLVDITDDGRGDIVIKLLATIEKVKGDQTFDAKVRACSVVLPAFRSSVLCEAYEPIFPDTIWDSPTAPRFGTSGRYQCLNPGCILTFEALTGLVGIELDDPGGLWPTPADSATFTCASGMAADCYPDHDDDKRPGISVLLAKDGAFPNPGGMTCSQGYTRRAAPLNANPLSIFGGVRRTDRLLLGTRVRLGGSGRISADCAGGDGGGIAEFVESRAAGCYVQEGTADPFGLPAGPDLECNATEAKFIDENLPVYTILRAGETPDAMLTLSDTTASAGPRFGLRRLGALSDDVDCADVRGATF